MGERVWNHWGQRGRCARMSSSWLSSPHAHTLHPVKPYGRWGCTAAFNSNGSTRVRSTHRTTWPTKSLQRKENKKKTCNIKSCFSARSRLVFPHYEWLILTHESASVMRSAIKISIHNKQHWNRLQCCMGYHFFLQFDNCYSRNSLKCLKRLQQVWQSNFSKYTVTDYLQYCTFFSNQESKQYIYLHFFPDRYLWPQFAYLGFFKTSFRVSEKLPVI